MTLPLRYQPNRLAKCLTAQTLTTENKVRGRKKFDSFVNKTAVAISWSWRYCKLPSRIPGCQCIMKSQDGLFLWSQDGLLYLENFILVPKNCTGRSCLWLINTVTTLLFHNKTLLYEYHSHLKVNMLTNINCCKRLNYYSHLHTEDRVIHTHTQTMLRVNYYILI